MIITDFIVAIELSSTKIKGLAGRINADKSVHLLAFAEENSAGSIEKGVVYNLDKTAQSLKQVIASLEKQLDAKISKAYVGVGGLSLQGIKRTEERTLGEDTKISQALIDVLINDSRDTIAPEYEILHTEPQEYKVGNNILKDPVGVLAEHITANFLHIVTKKTYKNKIKECFKQAGCEIAGYIVQPIATADALLSVNEKRSGCALVDFGAETTSVAVFTDNKLRHLAVLPLGGRNITKDLTTHRIEEADAEILKIRYGAAYTEEGEETDHSGEEYRIENKAIDKISFEETVEARINEIILNVDHQITQSAYKDKLLNDVVLTGGTAQLSKIEDVFSAKTQLAKTRIALHTELAIVGDIKLNDNGRYTTLLGILLNGTENCKKVDPKAGLFEAEEAQRKAREEKKQEEQKAHEEEAKRIAEEEKRKEIERQQAEIAKQDKAQKLAEGKACLTQALESLKEDKPESAKAQIATAKKLNLPELSEEISQAEQALKEYKSRHSIFSKVKVSIEKFLGDDNWETNKKE